MTHISCDQFREKLHPLLDGELDAQEEADLREHMANCPDCRAEFEAMRSLIEELHHLDDDLQTPLEFERGWRKAVRAESHARRTRGWVRALSGVAAAFVALMGVTAFNRATGRLPSTDIETPTAYVEAANTPASKDGDALMYSATDENTEDASGALARSADVATASLTGVQDADTAGIQPKFDYSDDDSLGATSSGSSGLLDVSQSDTGSSLKVLRSASLTLETENFDEDMASIKSTVARYGGLFERNAVSGKVGNRRAELTLRVPAALLETYVEQLRGLCSVLQSEISAQDITSQYSDTALRLDTYRVQLERINQLTTTAEDLDAVLALEEEASRLQYEIDKLTGTLNGWDSQAEMSTVTIVLTEYTSVDAAMGTSGLSGRIGQQFSQSMNTIRIFLGDMMLSAIALLPHLAWILPTGALLALGVHRARRAGARRQRHAD